MFPFGVFLLDRFYFVGLIFCLRCLFIVFGWYWHYCLWWLRFCFFRLLTLCLTWVCFLLFGVIICGCCVLIGEFGCFGFWLYFGLVDFCCEVCCLVLMLIYGWFDSIDC